jgi:hypothetical protein
MKTTSTFKVIFFCLVVYLSVAVVAVVRAAIPSTINYQGYLTDQNGASVDGTVSATFRIYDSDTNGTLLWNETQSLNVVNGVYSVELGSITPLALTFEIPYWLTIEVEADGEMTPRQALSSVGYALNADRLDGVDSSGYATSSHNHNADYVLKSGDTMTNNLTVTGRVQASTFLIAPTVMPSSSDNGQSLEVRAATGNNAQGGHLTLKSGSTSCYRGGGRSEQSCRLGCYCRRGCCYKWW